MTNEPKEPENKDFLVTVCSSYLVNAKDEAQAETKALEEVIKEAKEGVFTPYFETKTV